MDKSDKDEIRNMIDFGGGESESKSESINTSGEETAEDFAPEDAAAEDFGEPYAAEEEIPDDYGGEPYDDEPYDNEDEDYGDDVDYDDDDEDYGDDDDEDYGDDDGDYGGDDEDVGSEQKKRAPKRIKLIRRCVILALILALIIAFAVTDTGFIGAYKTNFANNFRSIFGITAAPEADEGVESADDTDGGADNVGAEENDAQTVEEVQTKAQAEEQTEDVSENEDNKNIKYNTEEKLSVIIPYDYANTASYAEYSGGVVCAATNDLRYINSNGEVEWECATSVIDPILVTAGKYIFLAQEGGTKICLYEGGSLVFDTDTENNILTADVSKNGDSVLVTDKDMYNGCIEAYNKRGECIYMWSSGDMNVLDASISPSSRNIAAVMINTDSEVYSAVRIFDIEKEGVKNETIFEDTLLFDVKYIKDTANAFGDNAVVGVSSKGKTVFNITFENAPILHYTYDEKGNKLICAELNGIPTLMLFNAGGKQKGSAAADEIPSFLGVTSKYTMYNYGRDIILGKLGASKLSKYTAGMDIKDLIMADNDTFFVVYSNSLQLIRM
ncbi:MAG: DUF5711 family protein [Firmicutes bacterium]|nr:DUF5711 family protein [Bacillota bacterium]